MPTEKMRGHTGLSSPKEPAVKSMADARWSSWIIPETIGAII